ncbi:MAG: OmpA family protein [Bacteroidia bacterium]|nr:OmpA family protein [Bacteroidia bacterium]
MKNLFTTLILLIGIITVSIAEEKSSKEIKGDKHFFLYAFDKAIVSYKKAKQLTIGGQRKLAESYHNLNQNNESEMVYSKLISAGIGVLPEDYYNYGMILKGNGKYNDALQALDNFSKLKPDDLRAKSYIANKADFGKMLKDQNQFKVKHLEFNSKAKDFGTTYYKNKIVFSSSRSKAKMIVRKDNWTGMPYLDIYSSEIENEEFKKPEKFDKKTNGKMHDGPASFSKDGIFMAFTQNNYDTKRKDKVVQLEIYFSDYKDEKWSEPISFYLNNNNYSVGHPCLTSDGKTMFFTSDMPGGYGGADIYKTTKIANGDWGKAENLGNKINTEGDEMFPFFEEKTELFFFSSNGQFGIGGLDLFVCAMSKNEFGKVTNLGFPINTQYDDFAFIMDEKMEKGYFSSNRTDGSGDDDIYSFNVLTSLRQDKKINGIAKDKNEKIISNVLVTLYSNNDKAIETITTKEDGTYSFWVSTDKNFKLIGKKENYSDGEATVNTFGNEFIVKADVTLLTKDEAISKAISPGADLGKILKLNSIYFDLDKYNIRTDAQAELDKIVDAMNKNEKMIVKLSSYTDCRESKAYNQILSDKRASASVAYIQKRITNPERIYGKGYSESNLVNNCSCAGEVVSNCSEEEHQKNRRTEFIVVQK